MNIMSTITMTMTSCSNSNNHNAIVLQIVQILVSKKSMHRDLPFYIGIGLNSTYLCLLLYGELHMFKLFYKICWDYWNNYVAWESYRSNTPENCCVYVFCSRTNRHKKQRHSICSVAWVRLIITFVVHWTWTRSGTWMRAAWAMFWWYWAAFRAWCTPASLSHWCSIISRAAC